MHKERKIEIEIFLKRLNQYDMSQINGSDVETCLKNRGFTMYATKRPEVLKN